MNFNLKNIFKALCFSAPLPICIENLDSNASPFADLLSNHQINTSGAHCSAKIQGAVFNKAVEFFGVFKKVEPIDWRLAIVELENVEINAIGSFQLMEQ